MKGFFVESVMKLAGNAFAGANQKYVSPGEYKTCEKKEVFVTMPDGAKLCADISSPDFKKQWPVILLRYPYVMYDWIQNAYHSFFSSHGYAVVLLQVRGTNRSEGKLHPLMECEDGKAVLDWIGEQPWCDGNVVTMGASYCGAVQWAIAGYHHPLVKTMFISVFGADPYESFYHRGLFNGETWTEWAAQMMGDNKTNFFIGPEGTRLREKAFSVQPAIRLGEELIGEPCDFYTDWITNDKGTEDLWTKGDFARYKKAPEEMDIPVFLHGGYFDMFYHTMEASYRRLPQNIKDRSVFMIGPWGHNGTPGGDRKYPNEARGGMLQLSLALQWFDHIVKGKDYDGPIGGIEAYAIGEDKWDFFQNDFPFSKKVTLYLDSSKKSHKAFEASEKRPKNKGRVSYRYDPKDPVTSKGGRMIAGHNDKMGNPEMSCFQDPVGTRKDILNFVSKPFKTEQKICGSIKANVYVSSDVPATAFHIKICEVFSNGKALNIVDDYTDIRWLTPDKKKDYTPGSVRELEFETVDVNWKTKKGSRIRVDITSSSDPQFVPHKNTLEPWATATESVVATQTIYTGKKYPSRVILPILE